MGTNVKTNLSTDKLNDGDAITDVSAAEADAIAGGSMQPGIVPTLPQTSIDAGTKPGYPGTEPDPLMPRVE